MANKQIDVIVVGSGLAAFMTAKHLSEHMNVMVFTKLTKQNNNSNLAQGGIAAAIRADDHWVHHFEDTIEAGVHHNNRDAVTILTMEGPQAVQSIIDEGMEFDYEPSGKLSFGHEGAHSQRRIIHAGGDQTGKKLMNFVQNRVNVEMKENETVVQLLAHDNTIYGVQTITDDGNRNVYYAPSVVLATGGAGGLYYYTSNDSSITGTGLAMAYEIGAKLVDLEFMQFHPTLLSIGRKAVGLISEAVRGEGAYLVNDAGEKIMKGKHRLEDLAPRDVVARVIYKEIQKGNRVFLNISVVENFMSRFPSITSLCKQYGISLEKNLIPVVPGAHFFMGGIETNLQGETSIEGLYAVGEAACNGVHGANRLASNSLLECLVFTKRVAERIMRKGAVIGNIQFVRNNKKIQCPSYYPLPRKREIQQKMMDYAGIVRTEEGLLTLKTWLQQYEQAWEIPLQYEQKEDIEIAQMLQLCFLIVQSALAREESRGAHYRADFPYVKNEWEQKKVITCKYEGQLV